MKHLRLFQPRPFIIVSATLLAGMLIYTFFRETEPVFFTVVRNAGLGWLIDPLRSQTLKFALFLPEWFVYSIPDAIWAFAYSYLMTFIWRHRKSILRYLWLSLIPVFIAGIELLQISGIFPGTFTLPDLLSELTGMIIGILTGIYHLKTKYNEKPTTQIDFQT